MRNFKIFLWIFVIFLVQTVVLSPIHIFGAVPSAVLAFVMCVAILENEFRTAVIISGICAVVMGAIGGRNFTEITLFYAYSSIIVFAARKRPRYVGNFPKTIVWTFIMSAILEILLFVIREMTLDVSVIFSDALPTAVFNTVIAVILYPILKKTLYKEEKKKIAKYAASLITPDDFVYLDAGTTTGLMLEYLAGVRAAFVTNAVSHAQTLAKMGIRVYLIGGELKSSTEAVVGSQAMQMIQMYHFTKGFFGTNGITRREGFTTPDTSEAIVKSTAMKQCKDVYILTDKSKFGEVSSVTFGGFTDAKILTEEIPEEYQDSKNILKVE